MATSTRLISLGLAFLTALATADWQEPAAGTAMVNAPEGVQEVVLSNGFRVLVVPDSRTPRVAASLWYRVGAIQEPVGEHGSTHFLEHAIHQGTTSVGTRDLEAERPILREIAETEQKLLSVGNRERRRLRERGVFVDELAWPETPEMTELRQRLYALEDQDSRHREFWAEYLFYHRHGGIVWRHTDPVPATTGLEHLEMDMDLPKENLEIFFRLEADRMVNAVLRGWEAQRFTVLEQLLNSRSQGETRFAQALDAITGMSQPSYVVSGSSGHARDFAYFTRAAMIRIYERYFVPNNATLVLVGDCTLADVQRLAETYFGRIPRGAEPPAQMDIETDPSPGGTARLDWMEPLRPRVVVRHRIPAVGHPDRPVFDLIAALLRGRNGMLAATLTASRGDEAPECLGAEASASRAGFPGSLNLTAFGCRDDDLPALERVMLDLVQDLQHGQVDEAALARGRERLRMEWAQLRSARTLLSFQLGMFEVMDSWRTLAPYMESRERMTVHDIQRAAARYLVPSNRVIATTRQSSSPSPTPNRAGREPDSSP